MRQGFGRTLLVLVLLVPLSRASLGDSFPVNGNVAANGDIECGGVSGPSFTFNGGSGETWTLFHNLWPVGTSDQPSFGVDVTGGNWNFDGVTG
jgi:hypothetical protein